MVEEAVVGGPGASAVVGVASVAGLVVEQAFVVGLVGASIEGYAVVGTGAGPVAASALELQRAKRALHKKFKLLTIACCCAFGF